jgi:nucleotide-binding universal stress UspA family protein
VTEFPGRILLATDGSEGADLAAQKAADVAEATGSELHLVYVEPLPDFMKNGAGAPAYDRQLYARIEAEGEETLRKLVWRAKVRGATVAGAHLRMGSVAEEIVGLADELEAGLIVVGSRGLGRIKSTLAGSVSESVFRHAHRPVMVVRVTDDPPSGRGGGRPRARRVFPYVGGRATALLRGEA